MNLKTFEQFRRALVATGSPDDEEALEAIRQANSLLAADNKTWPELLAGKVTVSLQVTDSANAVNNFSKDRRASATEEEIEYWFEEVLTGRHSESFRTFLESLHEQWSRKKYLSPVQIGCLRDAYERSTGPRTFSGRRD